MLWTTEGNCIFFRGRLSAGPCFGPKGVDSPKSDGVALAAKLAMQFNRHQEKLLGAIAWSLDDQTKAFYRDEFVKEMRGSVIDDHFQLLPSQAAHAVALRWNVDVETVLLALSTLRGAH
jgi:hypothetical protein